MTGNARASNYFDETSELANASRVESYAIGAERKKAGPVLLCHMLPHGYPNQFLSASVDRSISSRASAR